MTVPVASCPAPLWLVFDLRIAAMGKARPRVVKGHAFMPPEYEAWRRALQWQVRSKVPSWAQRLLPLTGRLAFAVEFHAPHGSIACDLDNGAGAILDAIQVPPTKRGQKGQPGRAWGLIANDKQVKWLSAEVVDGPTRIRFSIEEMV